ncbi:MAG: hypothetical protein ABI600_19015 [Luteolibacter sp.]
MLLGSSITGRLPDRTYGFKGISNMGCDGGSAADALRAMDRGILPAAPLIIIEGNTLGLGASPKETEVARAMRSPWFEVGRRFSAVSATTRPSAFLYSKLLAGKIGAAGSPDGKDEDVSTKPYIPRKDSVSLKSSRERLLVVELADIIGRLAERGTLCWVVILPPKIRLDSPQHDLVVALAAEAQVPFWDLAAGIAPGKIQLTDGIHMAPASAALTVRELMREIGKR